MGIRHISEESFSFAGAGMTYDPIKDEFVVPAEPTA